MGTKLIINVIFFDIILAILMISFTSIQPPNISTPPTVQQAQAQANITWNLSVGRYHGNGYGPSSTLLTG